MSSDTLEPLHGLRTIFRKPLSVKSKDIYTGFGVTYAVIQMITLLRKALLILVAAESGCLSPTENISHIMKQKYNKGHTETVERLKSFVRQEWDKVSLSKLQQVVS